MNVAQLQRQLQNCYSHSIVYVDGVEVTDVRILVTDGSPREQVHLSTAAPKEQQ